MNAEFPCLLSAPGRAAILVISLQREEKRNAIDEEMALGIDGALNELEDDDELWVGIITGNEHRVLGRNRPAGRDRDREPSGVGPTGSSAAVGPSP